MVVWRHCHICHCWLPEEKMRMHGDSVFTCFRHKQPSAIDRWYDRIKAAPVRGVERVEDFVIPIDLRRCPANWYAYSFDPTAPTTNRPKVKQTKNEQSKIT